MRNPIIKVISSLTIIYFLGIALVACGTTPSELEGTALPDAPILVHSRDCIWIVDENTNTLAGNPFCLSRTGEEVIIGDAFLAGNDLVYIGVLERWAPEKEIGRVIIVYDPIANRVVSEIDLPAGPYKFIADDDYLYVSTQNHTVAVIDLETNQVVENILLDGWCSPREIVISHTGALYTFGCDTLISINEGEETRTTPSSLRFSEYIEGIGITDNDYLYVLLSDAIHIIGPTVSETVTSVDFEQCRALDIAVVNQEKAIVICRDQAMALVYDAAMHSVTSIHLPYEYSGVADVSERYAYLVTNYEDRVSVLDLESERIIDEIILSWTLDKF